MVIKMILPGGISVAVKSAIVRPQGIYTTWKPMWFGQYWILQMYASSSDGQQLP
jgi:hypothetical protein